MSGSGAIRTETLDVRRTARLAMLGPDGPQLRAVRELWYVLHGYAQLAAPFLEQFRAIDDGSRLFVAPEALSRFYEGSLTPGAHRDAPVGASWMTKEARESEIADYVAYLDRVHAAVTARFPGAPPRGPAVTVLGFSQGGSTAMRWVAAGRVAVARVIVWSTSMPPELDLSAADSPLRRAAFVHVVGTTDGFITPKVLEPELARLAAANFPFRRLTFEGGHRLDDDTLRAIAAAHAHDRTANQLDRSAGAKPI